MLYLIFTLFIFYTVCCCLDGSDLKPKWQKWLGNKLHNFGDKYVKQPKYNLPPIDVPEIPINLYETRFKPIIIKSKIEIPEMELMYRPDECLIEFSKQSCINALFKEIENNKEQLIKIDIEDNYYNNSKIIIGEIKVLKKED
jgi:hypothetical protein